ncbi:MAG TPA: hypothetical protein PLG66_07360, partial [Calditrichia bacterium]|nr:hypothetical protein [Calditrichia bacterium]
MLLIHVVTSPFGAIRREGNAERSSFPQQKRLVFPETRQNICGEVRFLIAPEHTDNPEEFTGAGISRIAIFYRLRTNQAIP